MSSFFSYFKGEIISDPPKHFIFAFHFMFIISASV